MVRSTSVSVRRTLLTQDVYKTQYARVVILQMPKLLSSVAQYVLPPKQTRSMSQERLNMKQSIERHNMQIGGMCLTDYHRGRNVRSANVVIVARC
uniref:Uncharacterized protein n=1 Tax=Leersia perrieri TaxID=77586 RepID=A0A0D9WXF7_9ORYZ